jgi:hypothetical protein
VNIINKGIRSLQGCSTQSLQRDMRTANEQDEILTRRSLDKSLPLTLMEDSPEVIRAMTSHRWDPMPPSIAPRISSSRTTLTTVLSSFPISRQTYFWIVEDI